MFITLVRLSPVQDVRMKNAAEANTLRGYRGVGDITFDLDGTLSSYIGWAIFEVDDTHPERGRGVIGTFNNFATLTLIRFARTQKRCRMCGVFDGETGASVWLLDDVVFTALLVRDVTALIGFHAGRVVRNDSKKR